MIKSVVEQLHRVKQASYQLLNCSEPTRNAVLLSLAKQLRHSTAQIIIENKKDLAVLSKEDAKYDRLFLSAERIESIAVDLEVVAALTHANHTILQEKILPNGLKIQKISVPLGVVAMIYESRPNVTIDAFALCFKTGNACILKGGKEALHSNQLLVTLIQDVLKAHHIDSHAIYLLPLEREALNMVLNSPQFVDVCIPRGSQSLIEFVRQHAKIPFIETGAGIVHIYFDESADLEKGQRIVANAKTRRVSVCNALDTLIVHQKRLQDLPVVVKLLKTKQVKIFADTASYAALKSFYPETLLYPAKPEHFGQEFLSYSMAIKTVASVEHAVQHIMQFSSSHSEAILTESETAKNYFLQHVDAAAVYVNTSTAFTDGGQFGMGAEIGISTQKLHARGPMGLDALTSYKWVIFGDGQIRP